MKVRTSVVTFHYSTEFNLLHLTVYEPLSRLATSVAALFKPMKELLCSHLVATVGITHKYRHYYNWLLVMQWMLWPELNSFMMSLTFSLSSCTQDTVEKQFFFLKSFKAYFTLWAWSVWVLWFLLGQPACQKSSPLSLDPLRRQERSSPDRKTKQI